MAQRPDLIDAAESFNQALQEARKNEGLSFEEESLAGRRLFSRRASLLSGAGVVLLTWAGAWWIARRASGARSPEARREERAA